MSSGLTDVATGSECKTEDVGLWARLLSLVWVEIFGFAECWDAWTCRMPFPAALALGIIPLQVKDLNFTPARTDKQVLVFTFYPVEMTFPPLPSVM